MNAARQRTSHVKPARTQMWPAVIVMLAAIGGAVVLGGGYLHVRAATAQAATALAGEKSAQAMNDAAGDAARMRLGTYDSRAIAVAYARSALVAQRLKDLQQQRADAAKAGDQKRIKSLEAQGEAMQIRMHLQGFSNAPVDEILNLVRDQLPQVAQQQNVAAIISSTNYHDTAVELVDVTDALVQLFQPDAQTRKVIVELRKQQPLPIEDVAKMPAKG